MNKDGMSSSVQSFKIFVNAHPRLRQAIRMHPEKLQLYYQKWLRFGEDHSYWDLDKKDQEAELETHDEKRDWLNKCIQIFQELDLEKMQKQVGSMRQFAKLAQTFLNDQNNTSTKWQNVNAKQNLFHIFKDSGKNND